MENLDTQILPLPVIGWMFTIACAVGLLAGTWLTIGMYMQGGKARDELAVRMLEDLLLFSIWLLGLAGGIGILTGISWGRPALELFCWVLMILLFISAWRRVRATPPPRLGPFVSLAIFVLPIFGVCVATILTLRSDAVVKQFSAIGAILAA